MDKKRVVVAMSGGVDSSVAAALLVQQGYEVIGITLDIWPTPVAGQEAERLGGCCSLAATEDARSVANRLQIPHYVLNFREVFRQFVIENFAEEYQRGRTPNPCIRCNQHIKFHVLLERAKALGAEYLSTGHYVRLAYDSDRNRYVLRRGLDAAKDQSYVLYVLTQDQLAHALFPVGDLVKEETRRLAASLGLRVAEKEESQEICFIPDDNYPRFLEGYVPGAARPGPILDKSGRVLGTHKGIIYYTVGQRKGLGISSPRPIYVIAIDKKRDALVVGGEEDLLSKGLVADEVNLVAVDKIDRAIHVTAKIRYKATEAQAQAWMEGADRLKVVFAKRQRAIAPGQAVVLYQEDVVIGGGTIVSSFNAA